MSSTARPLLLHWLRTLLELSLLALLIHCLFAYTAIPFWEFPGLDFHNLHTFHHCPHKNAPYLIAGSVCQDVGNRPMYYPPLLYWSFIWTRWFSFDLAYLLHAGSLLTSLLISFALLFVMIKRQQHPSRLKQAKLALFWLFLLGSFPFLFSLERGNTDCLVVLLWTLCAYLYIHRRYVLWGVCSVIVTLYKLYPAIPCLVVGIGFLSLLPSKQPGARSRLLQAAAGTAIALAAVLIPLLSSHLLYFNQVLPGFAGQNSGVAPFSHTVLGLENLIPGLSLWARGALLLSLVLCSLRKFASDPLLVFSLALAASTFFSGTSYDYNLVTTFPLLFLLYARSKQVHEYLFLIAGVACFLGNRELWHSISIPELRLITEVVWLLGLALGCGLFRQWFGLPCAKENKNIALSDGYGTKAA